MKRISVIIFLLVVLDSCKKEPADFIWERSFGKGNAYFAESSADSGIVACGTLNNKPYLLKLSKEKEVIVDYTSEYNGLFSSAWSDTSCFIATGSSNGKMLLECIDNSGTKSWDTTFTAGFQIALTSLYYSGKGSFLALGSAYPDSATVGKTGLLFVKFDTTGRIILKKEITETSFIASGLLSIDNSGNIFLPLTRQTSGKKPKASVAKYDSNLQKIWETELYNNPNYRAAGMSLILDNKGLIYVTGENEVSFENGVQNNSFIASLTGSGTVRWKNYLETTNSGSSLLFNDDILMILSMNCFIVNMINPDDGSDEGIIRMFNACDSKNTDAFGYDLDINYDGNILVSGTRGGNFYLALKSSLE